LNTAYSEYELFWLGVGLGGQLLFSLRVATQWWISERSGKCVVPVVYWVFGLCGGLCLFAYGWYRRDPVILLGQLFGTLVSFRNLMLSRRDIAEKETRERKSLPDRALWLKRRRAPIPTGSQAS